jgi:hypothetical protein
MRILHRLPLDEWFDDVPHPHDTMPIATDDKEKKKKTPHHKAYEIATGKNNPFAVGGSENIHDFDKKK